MLDHRVQAASRGELQRNPVHSAAVSLSAVQRACTEFRQNAFWFRPHARQMLTAVALALVVLLLSLWLLRPSLPSPLSAPSEGLTLPGPVVYVQGGSVDLSGLTIIPLLHLLPLVFSLPLPIPFRKIRLNLRMNSTVSELVFSTLKVGDIALRSRDTFREVVQLNVGGIATSFAGSFGSRVVLELEEQGGRKWSWCYTGAGRMSVDLERVAVGIDSRLLKPSGTDPLPRLSILNSSLSIGSLNSLQILGFGPMGFLANRLLPSLRQTLLVKGPIGLTSNHIVREVVRDEVLREGLRTVWKEVGGHLDLESFGSLTDDERIDTFKEPPILPDTKVTPVEKPAKPFHLSGSLVGRILLRHFPLPDYVPVLYRPGGTRAKLQSFNMLTEKVEFKMYESEILRLSFDGGSFAFESVAGSGADGGEGGVLIFTAENWEIQVQSHFKISANTSSLVAWTTGVPRLSEQGASLTTITSRTLQLRFHLSLSAAPPHLLLSSASLSPFTSIVPQITLETPSLQIGVELVNALTGSLSSQIAYATSVIIEQFVVEGVVEALQTTLGGLEEQLGELGVEFG